MCFSKPKTDLLSTSSILAQIVNPKVAILNLRQGKALNQKCPVCVRISLEYKNYTNGNC